MAPRKLIIGVYRTRISAFVMFLPLQFIFYLGSFFNRKLLIIKDNETNRLVTVLKLQNIFSTRRTYVYYQ